MTFTLTDFTQTGTNGQIRQIEITASGDFIAVTQANHRIILDRNFFDLPKFKLIDMQLYFNHHSINVTSLSEGQYKLTAHPKGLGGGGCGSKSVAPAGSIERSIDNALVKGDIDSLKGLINQNNVDTYINGLSILSKAVQLRHIECVRFLLETGANPNLTTIETRTTNGGITTLGAALPIEQKSLECVKLLLRYGADPNQVAGPINKRAPLIAVCLGKNIDEDLKLQFIAALLDAGANVNPEPDVAGLSPLIAASICNNKRVVKLLLEKGADLNVIANEGKNALQYAQEKNHVEIVKLIQDAQSAVPKKIADKISTRAVFLADSKNTIGELKQKNLNAAISKIILNTSFITILSSSQQATTMPLMLEAIASTIADEIPRLPEDLDAKSNEPLQHAASLGWAKAQQYFEQATAYNPKAVSAYHQKTSSSIGEAMLKEAAVTVTKTAINSMLGGSF